MESRRDLTVPTLRGRLLKVPMVQRSSSIALPYGEDFLDVHLPSRNLLCIVEPKDVHGVRDIHGEVRRLLRNPLGCKKLSELVKPGDEVVIISDDNTRLTPTNVIVPILLDELNEAGVEDSQVKIIMALGTHRKMTDSELGRKLGNTVLKRVEVKNHEYLDRECLIDLGQTKNKTPIKINKDVMKADVKIGVGNIVPHHICGWAGGAKIIQPGVSGKDTTAATHILGATSPVTLLGTVDNIVRNEMIRIARRVKLDMIVNTVLDRKGNVAEVVAGDVVQAADSGIKTSKKIYFAKTSTKTDIVLASSHPCDIEFWQAHKTLYSSGMVVKEGGTIIIATPCPEGVSVTHPELLEIGRLSSNQILPKLRRGEIEDGVGAALAIAFSVVKRHANVILVSDGISATDSENLGFEHADTVDQALSKAFARHGSRAKVTILPNAPDTVPIVEN